MKRQKTQAVAASRVETESEATVEMVTTSLVIDENGIAQVAVGVADFFVAARHGMGVVVSLQKSMVKCCRLLGHVPLERL